MLPVCVHLRGRCLPGDSDLVPDEELLETDPCPLDGSPAVVVELDNRLILGVYCFRQGFQCLGHFNYD